MKSDTLIRSEGMRLLVENMGLLEAEKFIMLIRSESFDYTEWQRQLWADKDVNALFSAAAQAFVPSADPP
jgi:hypothetical protein